MDVKGMVSSNLLDACLLFLDAFRFFFMPSIFENLFKGQRSNIILTHKVVVQVLTMVEDKVKCIHIAGNAVVRSGMYQMLMMHTVNHVVISQRRKSERYFQKSVFVRKIQPQIQLFLQQGLPFKTPAYLHEHLLKYVTYRLD